MFLIRRCTILGCTHASGTRGAVDFAEFPSHFFEFFAPRIFRPHAATDAAARIPGEVEAAQGFGMLQVAHQLNLALLDRVRTKRQLKPCENSFKTKRSRRSVKLLITAEDSPLQPPAGVWAVAAT